MRRLLLTFSYSMAMALGGTTTFADFAPPTCGTCSGSIYTLSYDAIGTNKFRITFSVDTSHYTGGGSLLDDVASKVSSHNPTSVSLVSAPNGAGRGRKSRSMLKIRAAKANGLLGGASWLATLKRWEGADEEGQVPPGRPILSATG
jgi:hypothetical protein